MEKLEELDPLSLDTIKFNIKHIKKYTSVATIIFSILVIVLSGIINKDSLK